MIRVFYHKDHDGECAASLVAHHDTSIDQIAFYAMTYDRKFPIDLIEHSDKVYILDYSIEPDEMRELLKITDNVIWIDHHKSAIEKYADFTWGDAPPKGINGNDVKDRTVENINGIREIDSRAGCGLTWSYFNPGKIAPEYVRLIGDRDSWTWKYGARTASFCSALQAYDTQPQAQVWRDLGYPGSFLLPNMVEHGEWITRYKARTIKTFIKENGFALEWEGHKCYVCNGNFGSEPFEAVAPDAEIWIQFYWHKSSWKISLYSKTVSVKDIAVKYGGGGHDKAAGFYRKTLAILP